MSLDEFLAIQDPSGSSVEEAPPPRLATHPLDQDLVRYRLGSGDVVTVTLTGLEGPTISSLYSVRIDAHGDVDLPLVGAVHLAGLDESASEKAIKNAYMPNIVRQMTVNLTVTEYETTRVLVTGAVLSPGMISLRHTERNPLFAVASAGGISNSASGFVTIHRVRDPAEPEAFDLMDPVAQAEALGKAPLQNGDIIMVSAAQPNTVFVGGLVNRPAPQAYPAGVEMNVLQVLAAAGGLREDVYPTLGTLIRRQPDGSDVRVKLNFPRIKRGDDQNIAMVAGDILWVPQTAGTKVIDFFNRNLFIRGGATITYNATGVEFLNSNARTEAFQSDEGSNNNFDPFGFLNPGNGLGPLGGAARRR